MNAITHETTVSGTIATASQAQREFSEEYSKGEFEEMNSRELLDRYAE